MAADDLYAQAEALLESCIEILGARAPATSFVSPGEPIYDCCPMLAVHIPVIGEAATSPAGGLSSGHRNSFGRVNLTTLVVSIVRCDEEVASQNLPDVPSKQAVAQEIYADAWTLWNGLYRLTADGELFHGCGERFLDGARVIDTLGGCVGYRISLRASLPGYDPS